jgi:hypothetical protein
MASRPKRSQSFNAGFSKYYNSLSDYVLLLDHKINVLNSMKMYRFQMMWCAKELSLLEYYMMLLCCHYIHLLTVC